jgi:hypothetical protein
MAAVGAAGVAAVAAGWGFLVSCRMRAVRVDSGNSIYNLNSSGFVFGSRNLRRPIRESPSLRPYMVYMY